MAKTLKFLIANAFVLSLNTEYYLYRIEEKYGFKVFNFIENGIVSFEK